MTFLLHALNADLGCLYELFVMEIFIRGFKEPHLLTHKCV